VRLVPLTAEHASALLPVALHEELWRWTVTEIRSAAELDRYIASALRDQELGTALPFATIHRASGTPVGSTRYGNYDPDNRRLEIGWTWVAPEFQRSAVNTEAKLLMLRHAFEELECIRVELKTDALNEKSRSAIQRLGAVQEGLFRKHMITSSGRLRDTVFYSILAEEWPGVRLRLEARLARH
jgi:RimJ/RimL family protein N-acetyltransferase